MLAGFVYSAPSGFWGMLCCTYASRSDHPRWTTSLQRVVSAMLFVWWLWKHGGKCWCCLKFMDADILSTPCFSVFPHSCCAACTAFLFVFCCTGGFVVRRVLVSSSFVGVALHDLGVWWPASCFPAECSCCTAECLESACLFLSGFPATSLQHAMSDIPSLCLMHERNRCLPVLLLACLCCISDPDAVPCRMLPVLLVVHGC